MQEEAFASRLTTQEKLLLAQAVHKLGAVQWPAISSLLLKHPCCKERPKELFTPEGCEEAYVGLMSSIGVNVPAEGATKPSSPLHLRLAQTFYLARMTELKSLIASYETRFTALMSEIAAIKSGALDASIQAELRGVLARKYGKRLLDSWVPPVEEVRRAVEAGPGEEAKEDEDGKNGEKAGTEKVVGEGLTGPAAKPGDDGSEKIGDEDVEMGKDETQVQAAKPEPQAGEAAVEAEEKGEEEEEGQQPKLATVSPTKSSRSELSPAPGSPLSDLPPAQAEETDSVEVQDSKENPTPVASNEAGRDAEPESEAEPEPEQTGTRSRKRKASLPPKGPPPKRSGRRAASPVETVEDNEMASDAGGEGEEGAEPEAEVEGEAEGDPEPEAEEEAPSARGRRASKRVTNVRAPANKKGTVPAPISPSARTKDSSPAISRRAPSVSSTTSATPAIGPEGGERRSARRGTRGRASDVSGSAQPLSATVKGTQQQQQREQSAAVESVKEDNEQDEEEKRPTRVSGRRKGVEAEVSTPSVEKRGKRGSIRTSVARDSVGDDDALGIGAGGEAKKERMTPASDAGGSVSTPAVPARLGRNGTRNHSASVSNSAASPRDLKSAQKLLFSLHDTISAHRNGNVFQNPVRKSDAPDYYDVIKRPMDLKTIKGRIRDGAITTIDEFERDVLLMFANAMMYNGKGSQVYEMAEEMLRESENQIAHFRSMQHDFGR